MGFCFGEGREWRHSCLKLLQRHVSAIRFSFLVHVQFVSARGTAVNSAGASLQGWVLPLCCRASSTPPQPPVGVLASSGFVREPRRNDMGSLIMKLCYEGLGLKQQK